MGIDSIVELQADINTFLEQSKQKKVSLTQEELLREAITQKGVSEKSRLAIMGMLLRETKNKDATLLFDAVEAGPEFVKLLLDAGFNINQTNDAGHTALFHAINTRKTAVVDFLLQRGVDINHVNHEGRTVLFYAVLMNNSALVKKLLEKGARCDVRDTKEGKTPFEYALENEFLLPVAKLMIFAGVPTFKQDGSDLLMGSVRVNTDWFPRTGSELDLPMLKMARDGLYNTVKVIFKGNPRISNEGGFFHEASHDFVSFILQVASKSYNFQEVSSGIESNLTNISWRLYQNRNDLFIKKMVFYILNFDPGASTGSSYSLQRAEALSGEIEVLSQELLKEPISTDDKGLSLMRRLQKNYKVEGKYLPVEEDEIPESIEKIWADYMRAYLEPVVSKECEPYLSKWVIHLTSSEGALEGPLKELMSMIKLIEVNTSKHTTHFLSKFSTFQSSKELRMLDSRYDERSESSHSP